MTFGRTLLGLDPGSVLEAERQADTRPSTADVDAITTGIVVGALGGARVAVIDEVRSKQFTVRLPILTEEYRAAVARVFSLEEQQSRGAWFLPEQVSIRTGAANLPYYFGRFARFAAGVARDEKPMVMFGGNSDALYYWAVLEPLFGKLFEPFDLRGPVPATGSADEQRDIWAQIDEFYTVLAIDAGEPLRQMRYGGGWSKLRSPEQIAVKRALLASIRKSMSNSLGARYRAYSTAALIERYYAKAKNAPPLMRQVVTKPLQRTLSAFFGGDWLEFVKYLGERPHPEEQIASKMPEPRLFVGADRSAASDDIAAAHGIPVTEVERIISTFWASATAESPIHKRLGIMRDLWRVVDDAHANQAPGMPSLWGLVEEYDYIDVEQDDKADSSLHNRGLYWTQLPAKTLHAIQDLWGGTFLQAYPEAIVTTLDPYARLCTTFGAALRFWNGIALTAWFLAEGPASRTDMKNAEHYYERDLAALDAIACPVDRKMFPELIAAESRLGPPQPVNEEVHEIGHTTGITLTLRVSMRTRRSGFESLRDVITRYRRNWAQLHLEPYLRTLWESEIKDCAREYFKLIEVKRKTPTLKQFANRADAPTNRWFGGDVSQLFRAFGEKSSVAPVRRQILRERPATFARRVFKHIGGVPTTWQDLAKSFEGQDRARLDDAWRAHQERVKLASLSLKYVQLREAIGRDPTLAEFGKNTFENLATALDPALKRIEYGSNLRFASEDLGQAWTTFSAVVQQCIAEQASRSPLKQC